MKLLNASGRFKLLLKNILSSRDQNEFNGYVFEALFAFDFESNGQVLHYEVKQMSNSLTSVDFLYEPTPSPKIYLELRLITEREEISKSISGQLNQGDTWEIVQGADDERKEIGRLQGLILSKCQTKDGNAVKFCRKSGSYNFIVVYISELFLGMIDKHDCMLAMYGYVAVRWEYRLKIFGLCQQLPHNSPDWIKQYYQKFTHFRDTIHGVLFVKDKIGHNTRYLDLELEYMLIPNLNIMNKVKFNKVSSHLSSFLKPWSRR